MALILALNPGNRHSPTLSRLARELLGSELIGAESCVVAIRAIKERLPDVVLLPAKPARGEADLMAHLKSVPGGVLTLRLPPVEMADAVDLAKQIREMLTGAPVAADVAPPPPRGTSPHMLAAARATINWIRKRREQWDHEPVPAQPVPQWSGVSPSASEVRHEPSERYETDHASEASPPDDTYADATQRNTWIPRVAAFAVVIGIVGGMVACWPQIRGAFGSTSAPVSAPVEVSRPAEVQPEPVGPLPAAKLEPEPDARENVSGWVAVFAPFEVSISQGGRGVQVDDRGRAMLPPGTHRLRFQNPALGYDETRTLEVKPADTTTVNLIPETTIIVTSSEPAEVFIDATRAGDTPYNGKISLGTHAVTVRTAGGERQLAVEATSKPVELEVEFSKP